MQLTERIHLVGGGPFTGFGLTDGPDSHIYAVDGGQEVALVDAGLGLGRSVGQLVANIERAGLEPDRVTQLLLTHYHGDHAGGAALLRERLGTAVAIAAEGAAALEDGDEQATGLAAARDAGVFPPEARLRPCPVANRLADGDSLTVGDLHLSFIATPGHCAGHGSYLLEVGEERAVFVGDAVFWAGRILLQAVPDCDLQAALASVRRLAGLSVDSFLPGHGSIAVSGGAVHLDMALKEIESLAVPKSIL